MKRTKFLALALVVAVMLMGAGYAWWTDELVINSTVTTGEVDLQFDANLEDLLFNEDNEGVAYGEITYSEDNKAANIVMENLYPGAEAKADLKIINTSTIPVRLQSLVFQSDNGSEDAQELENLQLMVKIDYDGEEGFDITKAITMEDYYYDSNTSSSSYFAEFFGLEIEEGTDIDIQITALLDEEVENDEDGEFSFTVTPTLVQFNAQ